MQDPLTWILFIVASGFALAWAAERGARRALQSECRGLRIESKMLELANGTGWWDRLSPEEQERGRKIVVAGSYGDKEAR